LTKAFLLALPACRQKERRKIFLASNQETILPSRMVFFIGTLWGAKFFLMITTGSYLWPSWETAFYTLVTSISTLKAKQTGSPFPSIIKKKSYWPGLEVPPGFFNAVK
jgi:hypothetical protein